VVEVLVFEGMMSIEHVDLQILFRGKKADPLSLFSISLSKEVNINYLALLKVVSHCGV
jgi:hypothetical protein